MPIQIDDTFEDKNKQLNEDLKYRECWRGHTYTKDICEQKEDYLEVIGGFVYCGRRDYPETKNISLTEIEKQSYCLNKCKDCIYETTGKWPNSISLKTKRIWNNEKHIEETFPITSLSKEDIITAIKKFNTNRTHPEVIAKREKEMSVQDIIEESDF